MIRTSLMKILMWAIIPIAFIIIFFVTVDYKQGEPWISLVFLMLAYLMVSASCASMMGRRHAILNYTITICAVVYYLIELIVAILFLYVYKDIPQWAFTIQLLFFVAFVLLFGIVYISNQKTNRQMEDFEREVNIVKQWKSRAAQMHLNNPSCKTKELLDVINATPVNSNSALMNIDEEITNLISDPSSIDAVIKKIKERNLLLKSFRL